MINQQKIDEYKNDISKILNVPVEKIQTFEEIPWLEKLERGTKSNVYHISIRSGSPPDEFVLKEYNPEAIDLSNSDSYLRDYFTEKSILIVAKRHEDLRKISPLIKSEEYAPFEEKKAILVKNINKKTLEQILSKDNILEKDNPLEKTSFKYGRIRDCLDICSQFDSLFPRYGIEIDKEINKLSSGQFSEIKQQSIADYAKNFAEYLKILYPSADDKIIKECRDDYSNLALKYCSDYTGIINDLYPPNISPTGFVDMGNVKIGPKVMPLGCLLCSPDVFDVLKKEKDGFYNLVSDYSKKTNIDPEIAANGALLEGLYGNIRVAAGLKRRSWGSKEEYSRFAKYAQEQANLLEEEGHISFLLKGR